MSTPSTIEVWRGPSQLDGSPIVLIASGIVRASANSKTGDMIQTWILRMGMSPMFALTHGLDRAICGMCMWASGNGCYVNVSRAPTAIFKAWVAGNVPSVAPEAAAQAIHRSGRSLRIGAYGDPAAVPAHIWRALLVGATNGHSGYTHAWRSFPALRPFVMASCDTSEDFAEATAAGWRTFRVRSGGEPIMAGEIMCPASAEGGHRTQCADCLLCAGAEKTARNIAIMDHGKFAKADYRPAGRMLAMAK